MVASAFTSPSALSAATLQPVRRPGSMARTGTDPSGAASSSASRFCAKTRMASSSARSLSLRRSSLSSEGRSSRSRASASARSSSWASTGGAPLRTTRARTSAAASSGEIRTRTRRTPSASPPRRLRPRPALGLVGQVNVFQLGERGGGADRTRELGSQDVLLTQRLEDAGPAGFAGIYPGGVVVDALDRPVVEAARDLFTVARDEGDGGPAVEQFERAGHRGGRKGELARDHGGAVRNGCVGHGKHTSAFVS